MLYNAIHHLHKDHLPCQNKRGSEHAVPPPPTNLDLEQPVYQDGNSGTLENAVGTAPGQWMPRETGQQEWNQLLPVVHKQHLQARGQKVVEFGRYKHSTYDVAYQGDNYRRWVIANIDEASVSGMKL